ncbi:MAG: PTS mannitol transporter subunit IICBA [Lachnospiraceae bacterium]|nr:PTS mannitol transporter subunit IICBA [Lachnospiraceae bacterium]
MKNTVQKFGKFLSAMVMPNIGAFIAWGFITALFIASGWLPNEKLSGLVSPMLNNLLPILVAYTGGKLVGGDRGGVIGAIAVMGVIVGAPDYPMLMGAMLMGPVAGFVIKTFDKAMEGNMPAGFEMLINNFSVGILGMILAIIGCYLIGPLMATILVILTAGVDVLVSHSLLPLAAIFIEPAKVLFLNNAINHGIFTPIATQQVAEAGKSIMFMLEANPGPGLGVLLAYWAFSPDETTKQSAPGAVIIHFFGGIHEIYFPYVLMNPQVIIAPIIGNICAITFFSFMKAGLVGPTSPGSIISFLAMSPKGSGIIITIAGVAIATAVSFIIASPIIKMSGSKSLEEAQAANAAAKAASKGQAAPVVANGEPKAAADVKKIVFACDAGMGSSAMGATKFRNRIKAERPDVTVINTSVDNIPADCDIAVVQTILVDRAVKSAPQAQMVTIGNFLADPALDALYKQVTDMSAPSVEAAPVEETVEAAPADDNILVEEGVKVGLASVSAEEAITAAGTLLNQLGYVDEEYIPAMIERNKIAPVYMGEGIAIPHGTADAKNRVKKSGIVVLQYPDGVDWGDGEKAQLVIGIAGVGDEHLAILGKITETICDPDLFASLKTTDDVALILKTFK